MIGDNPSAKMSRTAGDARECALDETARERLGDSDRPPAAGGVREEIRGRVGHLSGKAHASTLLVYLMGVPRLRSGLPSHARRIATTGKETAHSLEGAASLHVPARADLLFR